MAEQKDTLAERQYYTQDGDPCLLDALVRKEPGWAASRLREADRLLAHGREVTLALDAALASKEATVLKLLAVVEAAKWMRRDGVVGIWKGGRTHASDAAVAFDAALAALKGEKGGA